MKKTFFLCLLSIFLFTNCIQKDIEGTYSFWVKNSTSETITLKFIKGFAHDPEFLTKTVVLLPSEEKIIKIIGAGFGVKPNDCIKTNFSDMFSELVFDTYIDENKLEKELWQPENWKYYSISKWKAEYKMTITKEMLEE